MAKPHLVLAAGGTGGHMFPAQALAEAMLENGWRVTLATDARGARYTSGFPRDVRIQELQSATFARGGILSKVMVPIKIVAGVLGAVIRFVVDRPTVVAGFGGYPSIPALAASWLLRIPRLIHEQNGVLGRVNQVFVRRVNVLACGTWPTKLPSGVDGTHIGNPVRQSILDHMDIPMPDVDGPLHILVMGGSQGARVLSDIVPDAISGLPSDILDRLTVSHQARPEDEDRVREIYETSGASFEIKTFFDDVPQRMAKSQLVISRSGASSVADISVIGRPSILIPLAAAIRDEQTANARGLVDAEAAVMIPETRLDPATLCEQILAILTKSGAAQKMAENARSVGIPDAPKLLVDQVEKLGRRA